MFPALAGGFLTTRSPGKPSYFFLFLVEEKTWSEKEEIILPILELNFLFKF